MSESSKVLRMAGSYPEGWESHCKSRKRAVMTEPWKVPVKKLGKQVDKNAEGRLERVLNNTHNVHRRLIKQ